MFPTHKHGCHIFLANALIFMMETIITKEMSSHIFIGSNFSPDDILFTHTTLQSQAFI